MKIDKYEQIKKRHQFNNTGQQLEKMLHWEENDNGNVENLHFSSFFNTDNFLVRAGVHGCLQEQQFSAVFPEGH